MSRGTHEVGGRDLSEASGSKEEVCIKRYPLIGIVGPPGSGKSTLSGLIENIWTVPEYKVKVHEEKFTENPYLADFYDKPREFSLKSQEFFLESKVEQLRGISDLLVETCVVADPALEMDYIYALAHREMGWMSEEQISKYQERYWSLKRENNIPSPDIFVVVNAPSEVIRQRIQTRGREFELAMIEKQPEYFDKLCELTELFCSTRRGEIPAISINSEKMDFVSTPSGKFAAIDEVGNQVHYYLQNHMNGNSHDGAELIIPEFL